MASAIVTVYSLATSSTHAAPAPQTPTLVFEAHVGERASGVAAVMDPVLDELERCGFAARPGSIRKLLGNKAPRPGIVDGGKTSGEIAQLVESGFDAFTKGNFKEAVAALALAVTQIKRNPALLVLDTMNAKAVFNAFAGLALSQARLGNGPESVETMTELLRMSSTQTIGRAEYGPRAEQFYRSVQKQTQMMGRGRLAIKAGDDHAMIFVDGELRGMGKAALADLIPGIYRVFIQVPGTSGRQYEIEVRANDSSVLDIDWQLDSKLTVSDPWVGFVFATEAERTKEALYAAALARRWGSEAIVVIGTAQLKGKPAVSATMYRANGKIVRSGVVTPDEGGEATLRSLARFVADGTPSQEVRIVSDDRRLAPKSWHGHLSLPAAMFLGGGLTALGVAAWLYAIDQDPGHTDSRGDQTRTYRNTAPFGVAAGVAGIASIGVGIWLLARKQHEPPTAAPVVSVTPSSAVIGWTGRF